MRPLLLASSLLLLLPAGAALARVDAGDVATSAGISASLYSTFKDDKRIIPARDELSAFVASGGAIRGAYLESALAQARHDNPGLQISDEELAKALLSQDDSAVGQ
ncbi:MULTISPECIES: DUF2388 domain-containing protein [Pseudomonas]|uniref:DUF2388 domain-containing protein n=1 Tax=Pseudomonas TaxID=286 RepID=UPI001F011736|nr:MULTISPECIES: DUF2388 domain-containing protein [Pseudomonas]MCG8292091.1 DUF2388 domain-containing protein [Pseudomonas entomophila]